MKVQVLGNANVETLELIDREAGVNVASDIVENFGGFTDGQFIYNPESGNYECEPETFEWWQRVLLDQQHLVDRIADLKDQYGVDHVQKVLDCVGSYDLEDEAAAINFALDKEFGEED